MHATLEENYSRALILKREHPNWQLMCSSPHQHPWMDACPSRFALIKTPVAHMLLWLQVLFWNQRLKATFNEKCTYYQAVTASAQMFPYLLGVYIYHHNIRVWCGPLFQAKCLDGSASLILSHLSMVVDVQFYLSLFRSHMGLGFGVLGVAHMIS